MDNFKKQSIEISKVVHLYFKGIFEGNTELLKNCFHSTANLFGEVKGSEYSKSLDDYLSGVRDRQSPKELGEDQKMKIISLDILGNVAVAKLHVPMLGFNYYDFLSLAVVDNQWKIVNKVFTHVE